MKPSFGCSIHSWIPPKWTPDGGLHAIQQTAEEALRFIKRVGAPTLALHLDTFHMCIEETSFYESVVAAGSLAFMRKMAEKYA